MTIIKKQYVTDRFWVDGEEGALNKQTMEVDIQPEMIEVKLYSTDNPSIINIWHKIPLSTFQFNGIYEQSSWTVPNKFSIQDTENGPSALTIESYMLIDLFAGSFNRKGSRVADADLFDHSVYTIFFPSQDSDFSQCTFVVRTPSGDAEYTLDGITATGTISVGKELISPVTLTSTQTTVGVDGFVTVNVSSPDVSDIYLEQIVGIPNKLRVPMTDGQGSFKIYATGLEAGDTVRIKAGHKKFVSFSQISIPVV